MTTVEEAAADKAARLESYRRAAKARDRAYPRGAGFSVCRGVSESGCNTGRPVGSNGFCHVCDARVVTLSMRGYAITPPTALWLSYATHRAKTPQSAPKPRRLAATTAKPTAPTQDARAPLLDMWIAPDAPSATTYNVTPAPATDAGVDTLRAELAALRANINNPDYLRAQLARLDAKAARIAELEAELASLKANE